MNGFAVIIEAIFIIEFGVELRVGDGGSIGKHTLMTFFGSDDDDDDEDWVT